MENQVIHHIFRTTLEDAKAIDVVWLDVHNLTAVTDHMVICTGRSNRHVKSIADRILEAAKLHQHKAIGVQGYQHGEWVLVDLVEAIIHIMLPDKREFYDLESLWFDPGLAANQL